MSDPSQSMKAWATLKDYFGRELEVGRFIVYAGLMAARRSCRSG